MDGFWELLAALLAVLARSWRGLGAVLGGLGRSWAAPGRAWRPLGRFLDVLGRLLGSLGRFLGGSWALLGGPWTLLGGSWAILGALGHLCCYQNVLFSRRPRVKLFFDMFDVFFTGFRSKASLRTASLPVHIPS